jgi:hypothetical protein
VAGLAQPVGPGHLFEVRGRLHTGHLTVLDLLDGAQGEHGKGAEASGGTDTINLI